MCGDNFLVYTHQEVTAANQRRFYSQVMFPPEVLPSLPTKAVYAWLATGWGVSQEAEYDSKCNRHRDYNNCRMSCNEEF